MSVTPGPTPNTDQLFRLISEVIQEYSLILLDPEGTIVSWTAAAERIDHLRADDVIGEPLAMIWPEGVKLDAATAMAEAASAGKVELEGWRTRPDGSRYWAHLLLIATRNAGRELTGFVRIVRDETDRRHTAEQLTRSEQRFRSLVENSSDLVALIDHEARVQYISPAVERIIGYTPEAIMGVSGLDLIHPDDLPIARALLRDVLTTAGELFHRELRVRHIDGRYRTLEVAARNMLDVAGVGGLVVNAHDVTDRKQLEDKLRQAQKMEAVGRLAGGIAHDFNNLLTAIRGHAELLIEATEGEPYRQDVEEIARAADRAASLTRQLLAFSRRQILQPRVLSLDVVVAELETLLRRLIGEDIELIRRVDGEHLTVRADRSQIEQVVMNLAVNARDAMPFGGTLTIEVAACEIDQEYARRNAGAVRGKYIRLRVTDNGKGMDARTMSHIFEPFFTTKEVGKGTGLGLATVYGIVKQSGGYIAVESELNRGTRFDVFLPAVRVEAEPATEPKLPTAAPAVPATILLVEDERSVRDFVARVLRSRGHHVLEAANGSDALRVAREFPGPIDLLLTDIMMPNMSGRELVEQLRSVRSNLRVILMSGYTNDDLAQRGMLGAPDTQFLEKPFTPEQLLNAVQAIPGTGHSFSR